MAEEREVRVREAKDGTYCVENSSSEGSYDGQHYTNDPEEAVKVGQERSEEMDCELIIQRGVREEVEKIEK